MSLTPTMLAVLRAIERLGPGDARLLCPISTRRALLKRGIMDQAFRMLRRVSDSGRTYPIQEGVRKFLVRRRFNTKRWNFEVGTRMDGVQERDGLWRVWPPHDRDAWVTGMPREYLRLAGRKRRNRTRR